MKLPFIVYSNSEYLDVLDIFLEYSKDISKTLIIDAATENKKKSVFEHFQRVIFYEEAMKFSDRLFHCISQVEEDYFLLTHEHDIIINYDAKFLDGIVCLMKENGWDKCGLHPLDDCRNTPDPNNKIFFKANYKNYFWERCSLAELENPCCFIAPHITNYQYNVNPTIWKKESLLKLMEKHPNTDYREIEMKVMPDMDKMNAKNVCSVPRLNCGYHSSTPIYKYLHITKYNKFLPVNKDKITQYGQSYQDVSDEYTKIVEKFELKNSKRGIHD